MFFSPQEKTELVLYAEIPVDESTFSRIGGDYKQAVSELVGGQEVTVTKVEGVTADLFSRAKMARPAKVCEKGLPLLQLLQLLQLAPPGPGPGPGPGPLTPKPPSGL